MEINSIFPFFKMNKIWLDIEQNVREIVATPWKLGDITSATRIWTFLHIERQKKCFPVESWAFSFPLFSTWFLEFWISKQTPNLIIHNKSKCTFLPFPWDSRPAKTSWMWMKIYLDWLHSYLTHTSQEHHQTKKSHIF